MRASAKNIKEVTPTERIKSPTAHFYGKVGENYFHFEIRVLVRFGGAIPLRNPAFEGKTDLRRGEVR